MSGISTHVLDLAGGTPAREVRVTLERRDASGAWSTIGVRGTDGDGRAIDLSGPGDPVPGTYRLTFAIGDYFRGRGEACFFPEAAVVFEIADGTRSAHVPLLVSPFGYSTYRGS